MVFIKKEFTNTLEIKKSKFIAHLCPYEDFDNMMLRLKQEHPKARHFVYAYRYLNEHDQIVENSSDDGEPKGTSGKPSLKALGGSSLINTGVIIVRYFGGIRLGTGGLVRAYSDAVNSVCEIAQTYQYQKLETKKLIIEYSNLSKVEYTINQLDIKIKEKLFGNDVTLILEASKKRLNQLHHYLFLES
jgi:uncharacterized YigZ family protein